MLSTCYGDSISQSYRSEHMRACMVVQRAKVGFVIPGRGHGMSPLLVNTVIPRHSVVTLSGRSEFFDRTEAFHRSIRESRVPLPLVPPFITYGIITIGGTCCVFSSRGGLPFRSDIARSHLRTRNFVVDDLFTFGGRARHSEGEGGQSDDVSCSIRPCHITHSTQHTQQTSI